MIAASSTLGADAVPSSCRDPRRRGPRARAARGGGRSFARRRAVPGPVRRAAAAGGAGRDAGADGRAGARARSGPRSGGELGAGKTTFVRGALRALGVTEPVTSPTFVVGLLYEGAGSGPLAHLDLYR